MASPWRNGGGVTRELAAWPAGAADWTWRISVAEVAASGPFSCFPGVQRWFAVLSGSGVRLRLPQAEHRLTAASAPFEFDGAVPVDCALLDGPTQDLNLMVRRDRAVARMRRLSGRQRLLADAARTVAVYAAGAPARLRDENAVFELPAHGLAWRVVPAGVPVEVTTTDALWMEIEP
ncbi:MAG TPA: HutD family protein [Ramlibacter sp.]|nr:HutD family protein [Ramlibacter sp.]